MSCQLKQNKIMKIKIKFLKYKVWRFFISKKIEGFN